MASVAEETTAWILEQSTWMAPLKGGGVKFGLGVAVGSFGSELRKKVPPAREQDLASER